MDIEVNEKQQDKIIIIDDVPELNEYEKKMLEGTKNAKELCELEKIEKPIIINDRKMFIEMAKVVALVQNGHKPLDNPSDMSYKEKQAIIKSMAFFVDNLDLEAMKEKFNDVCCDNLFTPKADFSSMTINPFIN